MMDETFQPHRDFSLRNYMEESRRNGHLIEARILFTRDAARHTAARHLFGYVEQCETPNGVEMSFLTPSLRWLACWMMSYGTAARALCPEELCTMVTGMARSIVEQYNREEEFA
jgi:predicted DNA-binding transcriptional regulator YafY